MAETNDQSYLSPYREAVDQYGAGFEATLWNSPEAQRIRFQVMAEMVTLDDTVILDIGCGMGDFAGYLHREEIIFDRYIGLDAVAEMITHARKRRLERCEFLVGDPLEDPALLESVHPDYVCISGTLNTMDEPVAQRLVLAGFRAAQQAVVFNFLSNRPDPRWAEQDLAPARRFDTVAWLDWALDLSPRISFTQDYMDGHDATIVIRH